MGMMHYISKDAPIMIPQTIKMKKELSEKIKESQETKMQPLRNAR
jgi:hypothetical protein